MNQEHPEHCPQCGGNTQPVLHLTLKGPWLRALEYIAKKEDMDVGSVLFWLLQGGIDNHISYDIDVPEDMFLGSNIGLWESLRKDTLDFARYLLAHCEKDHLEETEYSNEYHEGTITKQELLAGIARLEKLMQE